MDPIEAYQAALSRRQFLNRSSVGLGAAVLGSLVSQQASAAPAIAPRDQPNSRIIGATNTDRVATAAPWRAKLAHAAQATMTQP